MAKAFTDIAIRNLKAGDVRREIPDPGCAGLYLVLQPSGSRSWAVRYRHQGVPRKLTLPGGLTLAAARKLASDALYDLTRGSDPSEGRKTAQQKAATAKAETVQWVCEQWLKREGSKLRTGDERDRTFKLLVYPEIGSVPLATLKRSQIIKLLDKVQDERGDRTADLMLAYLRKALNWHASRVDDFNSPIVKGMGRYDAKANEGRRVLTDDELRTIWKATAPDAKAPQPFHALVRFLLLTAARRTEANEMPRSEVKGSDWILPKARNKVKFDLVRPLSKAAMEVLESVPVIGDGAFVFSNDGRHPLSLTRPQARLIAATGVTDWTPHDLRRTSRTLLSRAGVTSDIGERCLGHVIPGVRGIYDKHKYHREMLHAFEALAAQIERIISPAGDTVVALRR